MAKIVKKVSVDKSQKSNDSSVSENSIKKTTVKPDGYSHKENCSTQAFNVNGVEHATEDQNDFVNSKEREKTQTITDDITTEGAAELLIQTFGSSVFDNIRRNEIFNLPLHDANINLNEWLGEILNTYIKFEDINRIVLSIKKSRVKEISQKEQIEELIQELDKTQKLYDEKIVTLYDELKEIKAQTVKQNKKISSYLPISALTKAIPDIEPFSTIKVLIEEASEETSNDTGIFFVSFIKALIVLMKNVDAPAESEQEKMEMLHNVLSKLLSDISELYISQRRALLDELAKIANSYMDEYIFISPEETLQIDPMIHNAKGLGGSRIKEGISYAVLEKSTRKTVKYADIKV